MIICARPLTKGQWALKGDAFIFGFPADVTGDIQDPTITNVGEPAIPLSATQDKATIFAGTNNWPQGSSVQTSGLYLQVPWPGNPGIDNRAYALDQAQPVAHLLVDKEIAASSWTPAGTSLQPELINITDLDLAGASTKSLSHKLFMHVSYAWSCHDNVTPYLGIGAEGEFGRQDYRCSRRCQTGISCAQDQQVAPCNYPPTCSNCTACNAQVAQSACCKTCSLSQWGAWIKGGVSF